MLAFAQLWRCGTKNVTGFGFVRVNLANASSTIISCAPLNETTYVFSWSIYDGWNGASGFNKDGTKFGLTVGMTVTGTPMFRLFDVSSGKVILHAGIGVGGLVSER